MKSRMTTALIVMLMAGWAAGMPSNRGTARTSAPARSLGLKIAKSTTNPIFVSALKGYFWLPYENDAVDVSVNTRSLASRPAPTTPASDATMTLSARR